MAQPVKVVDTSKPALKINMAVADFAGLNVSQEDAAIVTVFLRSELVNLGSYNIMDRGNMEAILAGQKFQSGGCTEQECAVQMGKLLSVQRIAVGTLSKRQDVYYVTVSLVDVETGKIFASYTQEAASAGELKKACAILSLKIYAGSELALKIDTPVVREAPKAQAAVLSAPAAPAAPAEKFWELDTRSSLRWTGVTGRGKATSFYNNGTFLTSEPALLLRRPFASGWTATAEFRPRVTGDDLVDIKGLSVEALSLEVKNSSNIFSFGDYFASLSQYSMSQLLKGAGYQRNFRDEENYFRAALGSFDSQWEYLHSEDSNENMNRLGGGLRRQFSDSKSRVGVNWAFVNDDSGDKARVTTREDAYYQNVGAVDWEYRFGLFTLDAEHAAAVTTRAPLDSESKSNGGHANRARLQGSVLGARLTASFENVSPDFLPLAGSASQDRRRYLFQLNRRLSPVWQAFAKFSLNHDALGGSKALTRTTNTTYDFGATRTRLFKRKQSEAGLSWRRTQTGTHSGARERTVDRLQLTLSDQLSKAMRARLLVEPTIDKDQVRGTEIANYLYELRLSDRRRLPKSWTLNSTLSGRRRETENLLTMGYDLQNGAALRAEFSKPGGLQTGLDFDYTEMNVYSGVDSRTLRSRVFLGFKPKWPANSTVDLDYSLVRYGFADAAKEYVEQLIKMNFNWRL
ncbi:MAG: hypothetical protein Q7R35_09090 [Elusimicrobiota bacterium]|nr:hypothetical protein [Elusimicrobiota bacterium]